MSTSLHSSVAEHALRKRMVVGSIPTGGLICFLIKNAVSNFNIDLNLPKKLRANKGKKQCMLNLHRARLYI